MEFVTMQHDGYKVAVHIWDQVGGTTKGVVQLIHGLNEHMGRYQDFAEFLNKNGYIVVGDDHRAHGQTAGDPSKVGKITDRGDIFDKTVQDEREMTAWIVAKYKLPIVILGHSYGSFILQRYMFIGALDDNVTGIVLSGTAKLPKMMVHNALISTAGDSNGNARVLARHSFQRYDRHFKEGKNAWISKDPEVVAAYNNDPYTRDYLSKGFFHSFFSGVNKIFLNPNLTELKFMPIFIICGAKDSVGGYGRFSKALYYKYISLGLKDVCFTLYPNDRHEVLNETDKARVYADVLEHVDRCCDVHHEE